MAIRGDEGRPIEAIEGRLDERRQQELTTMLAREVG
jgi:hypothetical protein